MARPDDRHDGAALAIVRRYRLDAFVLVLVPYLLLVGRFWGVVDDAFISFRYARNFALGHGLRYNLGEHVPVEGYSNFLWVMVCAVFEFFRMEITFWPLLVSALCGVVLLWLVFDALRRRLEVGLTTACLATLFLGCFPPFAYWSTGGLETMPFALLVFVTFERLILRREGAAGLGAGIAGLLLALIRVEGIAWVVVLLVVAIVSRRLAGQRSLRPLLVYVLVVGIGCGVYFAGRYAYYGLPWANTVYAKLEPSADLLWRGACYVIVFVLTFLTPLLVVPGSLSALRRRRLAIGLPTAAMAWAFPAYAVAVNGDYMGMGRFLLPGFAFSTLLLGWMLHDISGSSRARRGVGACLAAGLILVGLLPAGNIHLIPKGVRAMFHFRHNARLYRSELEQVEKEAERVANWSGLGHALKYYVRDRTLREEHPSYVAAAIGAVGYYSDFVIFDRNGLVSPEVTRVEHPPGRLKSPGHDRTVAHEFFLEAKPLILHARLVSGADTAWVASECQRTLQQLRGSGAEPRLQREYAPELTRVPGTDPNGNPLYLVTMTRLEEGADPKAARDTFAQLLTGLRRGNHLPAPRPNP